MWVHCTGCSPSGIGCFSAGLPWCHKSCQQTFCSVGFSSLHGIVYSIFPRGHSLLRAHPPAPKLPPLQAAGASAHSTLLLISMQGLSCFTMVCTRSCSAICSTVPGAPPSSPSSLTLVDVGRCSCIFSFLFPAALSVALAFGLLPLNLLSQMHIQCHLPSGGYISELSGIASLVRGGSLCSFSEATPCRPPLPISCHADPTQQGRAEIICVLTAVLLPF